MSLWYFFNMQPLQRLRQVCSSVQSCHGLHSWHTQSMEADEYKTINKANSTNLYPPTKDYLRETGKSQNINPIYLTLSSPTVSFRS